MKYLESSQLAPAFQAGHAGSIPATRFPFQRRRRDLSGLEALKLGLEHLALDVLILAEVTHDVASQRPGEPRAVGRRRVQSLQRACSIISAEMIDCLHYVVRQPPP